MQPMTKKELEERIRISPLTAKTALTLSIEKWERLRLPENWEEICMDEDRSHPMFYTGGGTCALCQFQTSLISMDCGSCPLTDDNVRGCGRNSQYFQADLGIRYRERKRFMKASYNLLRRMRRALARLEGGSK